MGKWLSLVSAVFSVYDQIINTGGTYVTSQFLLVFLPDTVHPIYTISFCNVDDLILSKQLFCVGFKPDA